jgi:hypothetical protein
LAYNGVADVGAVIDYYSSGLTENHYWPGFVVPTGAVSQGPKYTYNHQEDININRSAYPNVYSAEASALTHISQTVNNQILTLDLWQWVEPYHFPGGANPWAF